MKELNNELFCWTGTWWGWGWIWDGGWDGLTVVFGPGTVGGWVGVIVWLTCWIWLPNDANVYCFETGLAPGDEKSNSVLLILSYNLSSKVNWVTVEALGWLAWVWTVWIVGVTVWTFVWTVCTTGGVTDWRIGVIFWWTFVLLWGRPLNDVTCSCFCTTVCTTGGGATSVFFTLFYYIFTGLAVTKVGDKIGSCIELVFLTPCKVFPILCVGWA